MGSVTNDWLPVIEKETKKDYYKKQIGRAHV